MVKRGKVIWANNNFLDFVNEIKVENNYKNGKSLNKVVEYAKVGKEIEKMLKKVGYL